MKWQNTQNQESHPRLRNILFSFVFAASFCSIASAQVPLQFTYQGRLTDSNGVPVVGVVTADFAIVRGGDAMSGGTTGHVENAVPVTTDVNGVFSHTLGTNAPINLNTFTDGIGSRWLQVSFDGEPLLPRQQLVSVPYALTAIGVVPPGSVLPYAGITASIPAGWLPCDGRLTNVVDHPRLFAALQYTYGGTGAQFRLPDMRGRVPMGAGQGSGLSNRTVGQSLGYETHTQTVANMPSHSHGGGNHVHHYDRVRSDPIGTQIEPNYFAPGSSRALWTGDHIQTDYSGNTIAPEGSGSPHNIIQPSLVLNTIIKD